MKIYTKTGDAGDTGLFGGARVGKDDLRVETYGTVDELNAFLGASRALAPPTELAELLDFLQDLLFVLGAELATAPQAKKKPAGVSEADIVALEGWIDRLDGALEPLRTFVLPGGTPLAASLHVARTVCRRAERRLVALERTGGERLPNARIVLNRLSDLLFVAARFANQAAGVSETPWEPRAG